MIQFVVGDVKEYNSFTVFLHFSKMKALGLKEGEIVHIISRAKKSVFAKVARAVQNAPVSNVLMSRALRLNLSCYLGQIVLVEKAQDIPEAGSVQVAPIGDTIEGIEGNFLSYLRKSEFYDFSRFPVQTGMVLPVWALQRVIEFVVVRCGPSDAVMITNASQIQCENKPVERTKHFKPFNVPSYDSIGGLDDLIYDLRSDIELPLIQPQIYETLGVKTHRGILITAPEGCGKTLIGQAIKNETPLHYEYIPGLDLVTRPVSEAGFILKKFVERAIAKSPSIVFIDDMDVIAKEQLYQDGAVDKRLSLALMGAVDRLLSTKGIAVVATATSSDDIPSELKVTNRFSRRFTIERPTEKQRSHIIKKLTRHTRISSAMSLEQLEYELKGQTGAELHLEIELMLLTKALSIVQQAANQDRDTVRLEKLGKVMIGQQEGDDEDDDEDHRSNSGMPEFSQNPFGQPFTASSKARPTLWNSDPFQSSDPFNANANANKSAPLQQHKAADLFRNKQKELKGDPFNTPATPETAAAEAEVKQKPKISRPKKGKRREEVDNPFSIKRTNK